MSLVWLRAAAALHLQHLQYLSLPILLHWAPWCFPATTFLAQSQTHAGWCSHSCCTPARSTTGFFLWAPPNMSGEALPKSAQQLAGPELPPLHTAVGAFDSHEWGWGRAFSLVLFAGPCFEASFIFVFCGEKLLQKQRQEMRLLPCNQVSLLCFDRLSVPPRATCLAIQCLHYPPYPTEMLERKLY